jgi:hypothetical protein
MIQGPLSLRPWPLTSPRTTRGLHTSTAPQLRLQRLLPPVLCCVCRPSSPWCAAPCLPVEDSSADRMQGFPLVSSDGMYSACSTQPLYACSPRFRGSPHATASPQGPERRGPTRGRAEMQTRQRSPSESACCACARLPLIVHGGPFRWNIRTSTRSRCGCLVYLPGRWVRLRVPQRAQCCRTMPCRQNDCESYCRHCTYRSVLMCKSSQQKAAPHAGTSQQLLANAPNHMQWQPCTPPRSRRRTTSPACPPVAPSETTGTATPARCEPTAPPATVAPATRSPTEAAEGVAQNGPHPKMLPSACAVMRPA